MIKKTIFVFSILALVLSLSAVAFGQETTGTIEGTVKDPQGAVIPGAAVTVSSAERTTGFTRTATTDQNGFYRVQYVPPGTYIVKVSAVTGFGEKSITNVKVVLGKTTPVDISVEATQVSAQVDITQTDSALIDPTDNKIQDNITSRLAESLPKGTNFTSLLKIAPAVRPEPLSGGFQIDGASGSENTFIIDGQEVTNFRTGTLNGNNNIPFQFVQEVQVKTSGFEAEFGGATGGVINVVTKGGNNQFHGDFGLSFTPSGFRADPNKILRVYQSGTENKTEYFVPRNKDGGTYFFPSANFSGPIIRDRAWFFLSYTPQIYTTNRLVDYFDVQDPATRRITQTLEYRQTQRNEYTFARVDAAITNNLRFNGAFTWNPISVLGTPPGFSSGFSAPPSANFGPGIGVISGPAYLDFTGGRQTSNNSTAQFVWTPTNKLVVNFRSGYSFLNEKIGNYGNPSNLDPRYVCSTASAPGTIPAEAGCVAGNQTTSILIQKLLFDVSTRTTFDADASYFVSSFGGRHEFKFGGQYNGLSNKSINRNTDQVVLYYGRTVAQRSGRPITPTAGSIGAGLLRQFGREGSVRSKNQAFYVQDRWQPTSWLSLNLGFRAEKEDVPSFKPGLPGIEFSWGDKIAPRIGGAVDLTRDGKTKVFGSYGWFYDRFKYELPRGSFGGEFFLDYYFEIFPGDGAWTSFTPTRILSGYSSPPGGFCPDNFRTGSNGRVRCVLDRRAPSNLPGNVLEVGGIDPDIKAFRQSELTFGVERELFTGWLLSGRYTHKQVDTAVEDVGFLNSQGSEIYIIGNPGKGSVKKAFESQGFIPIEAVRDYDAVEIRLDKRFSKNYFFNANYTYSRLYGNYAGLASSDEAGRTSPNVNRLFDLPFVGYTANGKRDDGRLPTDRPHVFKFYGGYNLEWNKVNSTEFSGFTTIQSGTPITTRVDILDVDTIPLFGRGDLGRTEGFTQTDFGVRHKYRFGSDGRFAMIFELDILNLFNERNELTRSQLISSRVFGPGDFGFTDNSAFIRALQRQSLSQQIVNALAPSERNVAYNLTDSFQGGRSIRFGFRFTF